MPLDPKVVYAPFMAAISDFIAETGVNAIKGMTKELSEELEEFYYSFFSELHKILVAGQTSTPSRFLNNMGGEEGWKPLSQTWTDRKIIGGGREDFYFGLTGKMKTVSRRSKKKKTSTRRYRKSFMDFMNSLSANSDKNVKKMFGALKINYSIQARGRKTPIVIEQTNNVIQNLGRITSHDTTGRIIPNFGNVLLTSEITMFHFLETVKAFSEWYVVDYLSKKTPVGDRRQWAKINSRRGIRGAPRPMRALVTPLISWYATTGMTQIVRKNYS